MQDVYRKFHMRIIKSKTLSEIREIAYEQKCELWFNFETIRERVQGDV
jgi:hypothetical protein